MAVNAQSATTGVAGNNWPGFMAVLVVTVSTALTTMAAANYTLVGQAIEGWRCLRLAWGTTSARPVTIGFWSAHHRTGVYSVAVNNATSTRAYATTYTQAVADVAQYNTVTIPGDTTGTWTIDAGVGMYVYFAVACGSTNTAPTPNTWAALAYYAASGQVNGVAATSDVFRITWVTIVYCNEAPNAARSPFIMRNYADELPLCRRYYLNEGSYGSSLWIPAIDTQPTSPYRRLFFRFPSVMRAAPAVAVTGVATTSAFAASNPRAIGITTFGCELQGDLTSGSGYSYMTTVVADARF